MRKYTAVYTPKKSKEAILHKYEAHNPKDAIEKAQKFDAWPNVAIYDDTYSAIPSYGEMIYLNGKIIKRSFDGPYLLKSLCIYDAIRTDLSYVSLRISNKILTITERPKTVQFVKDICVSINKLSSLCQKEAELNNEPCRWL